jgi:hypothetical protein
MRRLFRPLVEWWVGFWFTPAAPTSLAVCRVLLCAGLLYTYLPEDFAGWAGVSTAMWSPVWALERLGLGVAAGPMLGAIEFVWLTSLVLGLIGLWTRASLAVAFALSVYYFGLPHSFGHIYHFDALVTFTLGILALSRCGDALSVDRWYAARRGRPAVDESPEYTWPIRAVWMTMALIFFAAGTSKLRRSGLEWITSDTLSVFLTRAHYHVSDADPWVPWGLWLAQQPLFTTLLAAGTIVIETAFPLALVWPASRWVFVPGAFFMLLGIRALMGPTFGVFLLCNVFWVPWDRVFAWVRSRRSAPEPSPDRVQMSVETRVRGTDGSPAVPLVDEAR